MNFAEPNGHCWACKHGEPEELCWACYALPWEATFTDGECDKGLWEER